jgi:pimeloyl-ACP methyl ester carboxylesterase
MVTLKGCGHFTYLECPVRIHEQIDAFVAGKPAGQQEKSDAH